LYEYGNQAAVGAQQQAAQQQAAQQQVQLLRCLLLRWEHTLGGAVPLPMYGGFGYELRPGTANNDVNRIRQTYVPAIPAEAEARALLLLAESLTPAERKEAARHNCVTITGASGTRYRVRTNDGFARIEVLNDNDAVTARACVYPPGVPSGDAVLAKILHLKTDDVGLMRAAVVTPVEPVPLPNRNAFEGCWTLNREGWERRIRRTRQYRFYPWYHDDWEGYIDLAIAAAAAAACFLVLVCGY